MIRQIRNALENAHRTHLRPHPTCPLCSTETNLGGSPTIEEYEAPITRFLDQKRTNR
jgi:hypothetical protein